MNVGFAKMAACLSEEIVNDAFLSGTHGRNSGFVFRRIDLHTIAGNLLSRVDGGSVLRYMAMLMCLEMSRLHRLVGD